jgi:import inner membrane translocase subunit TIM8
VLFFLPSSFLSSCAVTHYQAQATAAGRQLKLLAMSWFGRGKKEADPEPASGFASETSAFGADDVSFSNTDLGRGGASGASSGSAMAAGDLREMIAAEQQRAVFQQVISRLTEVAFDSCIDRPGSTLSGGEERCIRSAVFKFLDTSEFVVGRTMKRS